MSDLYIEARLQAIKDIASASCTDEKDADNIASFCDEIYSAIPKLDKIIEEFARELHKGCNEMIKQTWGSNTAPISWAEAYADFKVDIDEIAKQLKEQK